MYFCLNFMINLDFLDIVSQQAPNMLNIILWCRRRTFLCVTLGRFQWPIIKFEIGSVSNFGHGNRKSKSAFRPKTPSRGKHSSLFVPLVS